MFGNIHVSVRVFVCPYELHCLTFDAWNTVQSLCVFDSNNPDRWEVGTSYAHHSTSNTHLYASFTLHFGMLLLHKYGKNVKEVNTWLSAIEVERKPILSYELLQ